MPAKKTGKTSLMARWRGLWPGRMHLRSARLAAWLDLLVVDLGLLRAPVNRPHEVAPGFWRSNQPTPWRLKSLARRGFKTVVNLRGEGRSGGFYLEQFHADKAGIHLVNLKMSSRRPPTVAQVAQLQSLFSQAPQPMLVHCKSGADRAGLVSTLYLIHTGVPATDAKKQLSLRFLHIKNASTGMMDYFVETYEAAHQSSGIAFDDWLHTEFDRDAMSRSFNGHRKGNWLVDRILRRE
ncbi:fused DSP-PTPase phosphatase/NAD kinase-like protein [Saccharospirillum impatiens]|uniref:fused DSP-PTPase phosphatase/NAD kinase-like protein n=1 Tax=Saccharospirillum impatiens TaxID=169438 RepID=UPI00040B2FAA|nr:sulfur transferase domain-containing protein [Saccharospirillum impatiens]